MLPITIEELRKVHAVSELPNEHLQWILDRSETFEYQDGESIVKTGEPIDALYLIIEGEISFYMDAKGKLVYYFTFGNDEQTGGVSGLIPYSRLKSSPGYSFASGKLRILKLHKSHFSELEQLNPEFIQRLIGYMTDRARAFATQQLQQEKVSALGKLAAGIAHELNNPASAISRTSDDLLKRSMLSFELTEKLLQHNISAENIRVIRQMVAAKIAEKASQQKLSTMQRIEKEEDIRDWIERNGIQNTSADEIFADAGLSADDLEQICKTVGKDSLNSVFQWLENLLSSERLIKELGEAATRISNLVNAIKSHVHMDRTNDIQPTNINTDIDNTVTLLGYKIRQKNINIVKNYQENLEHVDAFVSELNQVWTNIIDNAIFAVEQNGQITIQTCSDGRNVTTKITDNGSGISQDIITRIFDPFFTTKKVGEGTGIGLDLVNRIVKKHNGEIKVYSTAGKTQFSVCIPIKHIPAKEPVIKQS